MALTVDRKLVAIIAIAMATVSIAWGGVIRLDNQTSVQLKPENDVIQNIYRYFLQISRPLTILHFGKHSLCKGKIDEFEAAMSRKLKMDDSFVKRFVHNLCEQSPAMLALWAAELYDTDGDGYINELEKRAHTEPNTGD